MKDLLVAERHPNDELIRVDRLPHIWCPGCGLGNIISAYAKAVKNSPVPVHQHAIV